tara:strand:+ start:419 stop:832 length:414 start_codon:yes stop_codon:yes gene_type:complete
MKKSKFIEIIKKLIERERKLKEASVSSATPGFMTPNAFSKKKDGHKDPEEGGYKKVHEGKYHDYRNDETLTPRQKIGHSMREVRNALSELNKMIDMNVRLKNELNVDSRSYWKNTHKALGKISERLVKLANKVGKLQ